MLKAIIGTNPIAPRITIPERMVTSAGYSSKIRIKLENMRRTSHFLFLSVLPTHGRFITFIASQGKSTTVFPSTHCFSLFMQRLNSSDSRCSPTRTKHPYVQFTRLQRLSVGLSQRYATRFSDLVKWIKQSHMFTRGHAKHPCKQIKYSQRVAVCSIRP